MSHSRPGEQPKAVLVSRAFLGDRGRIQREARTFTPKAWQTRNAPLVENRADPAKSETTQSQIPFLVIGMSSMDLPAGGQNRAHNSMRLLSVTFTVSCIRRAVAGCAFEQVRLPCGQCPNHQFPGCRTRTR